MPFKRVNILVAESAHFSGEAARLLRRAGNLTMADLNRTGLLGSVSHANVLWVRLRHRIDREVLAAAPELRIIATPTTGLNHIDRDAAAQKRIEILSLRGETKFLESIHATAEHTVALTLALLRKVPAAARRVTEGGWDRDLFRGHELFGRTAGVIGYGRIGKMVARLFAAFGMRVLAADPFVAAHGLDAGVELVALPQVLAEADVVTLHVNHSRQTERFFGGPEFRAMKKGAWFVNTSRGEVVDERALLEALAGEHLSGAALDVLAAEHSTQIADHPLVAWSRGHSNLLITPHLGGCTAESMEKTEYFLAHKLVDFLEQRYEQAAGERTVPLLAH